jgi:hypothetical protein
LLRRRCRQRRAASRTSAASKILPMISNRQLSMAHFNRRNHKPLPRSSAPFVLPAANWLLRKRPYFGECDAARLPRAGRLLPRRSPQGAFAVLLLQNLSALCTTGHRYNEATIAYRPAVQSHPDRPWAGR